MNIKNWIDWFRIELEKKLSDGFELNYVSESGGDLGALEGVQFDSDEKGGYVYFWGSGYIGYQLMDYQTMEDIVTDTTCKIESDEKTMNMLLSLISQLTN